MRELQTEIYDCSVCDITADVNELQSSTNPINRSCQQVYENTKWFCVNIRGDKFCYNQIRMMIGAAIMVARGDIPLFVLKAALALPTAILFPLAPAVGLCLSTAGVYLSVSIYVIMLCVCVSVCPCLSNID